jgi:hypothetical protein
MPANSAASSNIALYQLKREDFKEATSNTNKIKTFLLKTIYDQYKYQVSTEIDNNEATPIKIHRYIHTNLMPVKSSPKATA